MKSHVIVSAGLESLKKSNAKRHPLLTFFAALPAYRKSGDASGYVLKHLDVNKTVPIIDEGLL